MATNRVTGMISGMDTESIVKSMVMPYQERYDKMYKEKTKIEWQKEDYTVAYSKVKDFRSKMTDFKMSATVNPMLANSSNKEVISVSANADALRVPHAINVKKLASAASTGSLEKMGSAENKTSLKTQFANTSGVDLKNEFTVKINGKEIKVDPTGSLNEFLADVSTAKAGVKASYDVTMDRVFFTSDATGAETTVDFSGTDEAGQKFLINALKFGSEWSDASTEKLGSGKKESLLTQFADKGVLPEFPEDAEDKTFGIMINGKEIKIDASKDIKAMIEAINSSEAGVVASYDDVNDTFLIKSSDAKTKIDFKGTDDAGLNFLQKGLKLKADGGTESVKKAVGGNAVFDLDGVNDLEQEGNSFTISGVTYNLAGLGEARVTVSQDVDKLVANVKEFVDLYNGLLEYANGELNEKKHKGYDPLTDEEQGALSDKQIEKWENLAKSGLLKGDEILRNLTSSMRNIMITNVGGIDGKYKNASSIGISTGSNWKEGGKLYLDEDKLKAAIAEDPGVIAKIFSGTGDKKGANQGVAAKLFDVMTGVQEKIDDKAGVLDGNADVNSVLGKKLTRLNSDMTAASKLITKKEDYFYNKYAQMEKALQQLQSQTNSILNM